MGKNTLLLHIGTPKTGTTSLQRFLFHNVEKMKGYGWDYPDIGKIVQGGGMGTSIINGLHLYKSENRLDTSSDNWISSWVYIKKQLQQYNVIVSAEDIYEWETERFIRETKNIYDNLKVIIYLRRQDLFMESMWNENIKCGDCDKSFTESIEDLSKKECHYLKTLDLISEIVGKKNLIVRVYEKSQLKGIRNDIVSDFFDAIGLEPDWLDFQEVGTWNERLFGNYLEFKRIFNSLKEFEDIIPFDYRQYFWQLSQLLPKEEKRINGYFSKNDREKFLKEFQKENETIAKKYLFSEDGVLFYDDDINIPEYKNVVSRSDADIVRLFGLMIGIEKRHTDEKISSLEKRIDNLENTARRESLS